MASKGVPGDIEPSPLARVLPANRGKNKEPTSGLEPLTCSLRVCGQGLLGVAQVCKSRIDKGFSVLCIAHYCRLLHAG
jgi:hypothetical protein